MKQIKSMILLYGENLKVVTFIAGRTIKEDYNEADEAMFSRGITFFLIISLDIPKIVVTLHPETGPLQLKGYVDVAHLCRLYGSF